jgi:uncharacterized protein (DUF1697 family)
MTIWIALMRGVNVGGTGKLPMAAFRQMLTVMGFEMVQTYIQSGNAVFRAGAASAAALGEAISDAVERDFGFRRKCHVLNHETLERALADCPFSVAEGHGNALHFVFMDPKTSQIDGAALDVLAAQGEKWAVRGDVLYLFTLAGLGKSKLAAGYERVLNTDVTARNLNSVRALAALAAASASVG